MKNAIKIITDIDMELKYFLIDLIKLIILI